MLRRESIGAWLLAGPAFAAALNFRPIYAAAIPSIDLLVFYQLYYIRAAKLLRALGFNIGILLALSPQFLINNHNIHSYSPLVLGQRDDKVSLYKWHLAYGMRVQKFESAFIESPTNIKLVIVNDPVGTQLLQRLTKGKPFSSMQQYAAAALKYPLDFVTLFARHLFSNLNIAYRSLYLVNLKDKGILFFIINFSIIFFGIIMLKRVRFKLLILNNCLGYFWLSQPHFL